MPEYKMYYMNMRARAELSRLILAAAEVPYEDIRFSMPEFKKTYKADAPFGQIPVFEIDGKKVCQSNSIARFLARQHGLAGKNDWESMRCDMIVDCIEDMIRPFMHAFRNADPQIKAAGLKKFGEEQLPMFLNYLEQFLTQNNGGSGYFVGDSLTWADLALHAGFGYCDMGNIKYDLHSYPHLKELFARIDSHPKIAKWLKERPQTFG